MNLLYHNLNKKKITYKKKNNFIMNLKKKKIELLKLKILIENKSNF